MSFAKLGPGSSERTSQLSWNGGTRIERGCILLQCRRPGLGGAFLDEIQRDRITIRDARNHFESQYILRVLEKVQGNQTEAARLLGLHRNTLASKIRQFRLRDRVSLPSE